MLVLDAIRHGDMFDIINCVTLRKCLQNCDEHRNQTFTLTFSLGKPRFK